MFTEMTVTKTFVRTNLGVFIKEDFLGFAKTNTHNIIGFPKYHSAIVTIAKYENASEAEQFLNTLMPNAEEKS